MAIPPQLKLGHQLTLKTLISPLLIINFVFYVILLAHAGWAFNKQYSDDGLQGNKLTSELITYTLLAGVVGIASVLSGVHYLWKWTPESKASATATSIVALPLTILSLGIASKSIEVGHLGDKKLKTLASFAIIIAPTHLLYTLVVHGLLGEDRIVGYTAPSAPAAPPAEEATKDIEAPETATEKPAPTEAAA